MKTITITATDGGSEVFTKSVTEQELIARFGEHALASLAAANGYPEIVPNPNYSAAVGDPYMVNPEAGVVEGAAEFIPNPDYVAESGELFIPNPESHLSFIARTMFTKAITETAKPAINGLLSQEIEQRKSELEAAVKSLV